jgi:hypothetical protein
VPQRVTLRGSAHSLDLIWVEQPQWGAFAHLAGTASIRSRRREPGVLGNMTIAETMLPAGKLPEQALAADGRERTTFQPFLDIPGRLKNGQKV